MSVTRRSLARWLCAAPFIATASSSRGSISTAAIDDIVEAIDKSVKIIGDATGQIRQAVDDGIKIYDDIQARWLQGTFKDIKTKMVNANGAKGQNILIFRDYLEGGPLAENWANIQKTCSEISALLKDMIDGVGAKLPQGMPVGPASQLQSALSYQQSLYAKLAQYPEPQSAADKTVLGKIVDRLEGLLDKVVALEGAVDVYIHKFE